MRAILILSVALVGFSSKSLHAQTIHPFGERSCIPNATTTIKVSGADLTDNLRCVATNPAISVEVESVQPTEAVLKLNVAADAEEGPFGLLVAGPTSLLRTQTMFVDSLPPMTDNGQNHSRETAQEVPGGKATIAGFCDGSASDFYRLEARAGERIAFEVLTQSLRSPMDPVLRLTNAAGETLLLVDDDAAGPEPRGVYAFEQAGEYWLEVHDSKFSAKGSDYQLRIGDFPVPTGCYPLAVQRGQTSQIGLIGDNQMDGTTRSVVVADVAAEIISVAARTNEAGAAAWLPLATSPYRQVTEEELAAADAPLSLPLGISGRLLAAGEKDSYRIAGEKERAYRFRTRTRSLGSPALVHLKLLGPDGKQVAETAVNASDEWSFDYTFAETGEYRLEVVDLLRRGGAGFSYWIEVVPSGTFSLAFKADAAVRENFVLQPSSGACAIDLSIGRFGYDGALDVRLLPETLPLKILNPTIAAGATEARLYVEAGDGWDAARLSMVQMVATPAGDANQPSVVAASRGLRRVKLPFVLAPPTADDGMLSLIGCATQPPLFAFEPAAAVRFARPVAKRPATLNLKRLQEGFGGTVNVLSSGLPDGWKVTASNDKDAYTTTFEGAVVEDAPFDTIELLAYGEHDGRGQLLKTSLPIEWFDPLQVECSVDRPAIAGGVLHVNVAVKRDGERQPVTLSLAAASAGITLPAPVSVLAEQDSVELALTIAAEVRGEISLRLKATSQIAAQEYAVESPSITAEVLPPPVELVVYPAEIQLSDARDQQQLVVSGVDAAGQVRDWTQFASFTMDQATIAKVDGSRLLPLADGSGTLQVSVGSTRVAVPVVVGGAQHERPIAFESETLVALSKQGCNSGACHGSPSGKGNFRLSLRAFDAKLDELTLIREESGRRVNVFKPELSLLLQKPLMKIAHGGGRQLHNSDKAYEVLRRWIEEGAQPDAAGTPRVVRLEVHPGEKRVLAVRDGGQQLAVTAHFADGTRRDVTELAAYETSNTSVAVVDVHGFVTPRDRGEAAILVRFLEHIESVPLMFIDQIENFVWQAPPTHNYIDELVDEKLEQLQFLPAEVCGDAEFLRRAHLDLIGILPTVEETREFLNDTAEDKRSQLVDRLLEREEFAKFWALKWGDLLRMTGKLVGDEGVFKYHRWVEESLRENMPYDEFARQLITASGSTLSNPPANFYRTATDMNESVENISQVFLGARLQCAKCHNHPFERWTQDNYYGLGAFFNRVQRRTTERPGEMFVYSSFSGEVTQPRTGETLKPWLPETGSIDPASDEDRRIRFAEWLVDPENPYFARMEANRIWSQFFVRGIVDPIDDFRDSNPPSNARLLDALAEDFVNHGYDRKQLIRTIMASRTYQASSHTNEWNHKDNLYASHQEPRLLTAEQMLDAINQSLGLQQTFGNLPASTKATQLPAPDLVKVDFLKTFGQPERSTVCACEREDNSNLSMAIELFNGPMIHGKLRDENNRFRKALADGRETSEIIEELYLATLSRYPSDEERLTALRHCDKQEDKAAALEDICWALFNSDEFLFQH